MHGFGSAWGCNSPGRLDKIYGREHVQQGMFTEHIHSIASSAGQAK
jgi:hypothetical protein